MIKAGQGGLSGNGREWQWQWPGTPQANTHSVLRMRKRPESLIYPCAAWPLCRKMMNEVPHRVSLSSGSDGPLFFQRIEASGPGDLRSQGSCKESKGLLVLCHHLKSRAASLWGSLVRPAKMSLSLGARAIHNLYIHQRTQCAHPTTTTPSPPSKPQPLRVITLLQVGFLNSGRRKALIRERTSPDYCHNSSEAEGPRISPGKLPTLI